VGQQDVVELGQEPHRDRRLRVGARGVGEVEELLAGLVAEGHELRAQRLERRGEPGEAGPLLGVHHRRRAERPEVTQDELLDRHRLLGPAEPVLDGRADGSSALVPQAARRQLDEGELVAQGVAEHRVLAVRPPLLELFAGVRGALRGVLQDLAAGFGDLVEVQALEAFRERAAGELAVELALGVGS
jgi:hypothetical protein